MKRPKNALAHRPELDGDAERTLTLAESNLAHVRRVLAENDGNKSKAARLLDIDRRTLCRMVGGDDSFENVDRTVRGYRQRPVDVQEVE